MKKPGKRRRKPTVGEIVEVGPVHNVTGKTERGFIKMLAPPFARVCLFDKLGRAARIVVVNAEAIKPGHRGKGITHIPPFGVEP